MKTPLRNLLDQVGKKGWGDKEVTDMVGTVDRRVYDLNKKWQSGDADGDAVLTELRSIFGIHIKEDGYRFLKKELSYR